METAQPTESTAQDRSASTPSNQSDGIGILPYVFMEGQWTLPDDMVMQYFAEMVGDGSYKLVFAHGDIRSPLQFLQFAQLPGNIGSFLVNDSQLGAFAWLNGIEDNHSFAHFHVMKWARGELAYKFGEKMLAHWFNIKNDDGTPMFDLLIGTIAKRNRSANNFVKRLGFKRVGEIPNIMKDVYHSSGKRDAMIVHYLARDNRDAR